jgi:hypothetical protein
MAMFTQILSFAAFAAGLGFAMTSALGDPAIGFAIGVGGAAVLSGATRRARFGEGEAQ